MKVNEVGMVSSTGIAGQLGLHAVDIVTSASIVLRGKNVGSDFGACFEGVFSLTTKPMHRYNKEDVMVKGNHRGKCKGNLLPSSSRPGWPVVTPQATYLCVHYTKSIKSATLPVSLFSFSLWHRCLRMVNT